MTPLDSILVTTDFTDAAHNALRRAALIAAQHGSSVTLLHVIDPDALKRPSPWGSSQADIDQRVAAAHVALARLADEQALRLGVKISPVVEVGRPLEYICRLTNQAHLLVMGPKRMNPLRSLVLGTPTEQLLRLVRRPLLLARQPTQAPYQRVLVAVDHDAEAGAMLRYGQALGSSASLHVHQVLSPFCQHRVRTHGVQEAVVLEGSDADQQRSLLRLRAMLTAAGLAGAEATVAQGDPALLTLEKQKELGADVVVLGQDGPATLCNFLLSNVAQQVISAGNCDVLLMPKVTRRKGSDLPKLAQATGRNEAHRRPAPSASVAENLAPSTAD